jgi:hypothetical protein
VEHLGELEAGREDDTSNRIVPTLSPPCAPGIAHHSAMQLIDMVNAIAASHGLRGPVRSETAPMSGASRATQTPTMVLAKLHASWPRTGSPITTLAKYGGKTKT